MDGGKKRVVSRGADAKDNTVIDQIMLRFRPIAPKPVTAQGSGCELPAKDLIQNKRVKRKYVRVKKKKNKNTAIQSAIYDDSKSNWFDLDTVLHDSNGSEHLVTDPVSNWISFDLPERKRKEMNIMNHLFTTEPQEPDLALAPAVHESKVMESWITVESVTGTCEDRRLLGYTDDEIWKYLESDSCPGFISNSYYEVQWVNPAYRSMVDLNSEATNVAVWLVLKVEKSTVVKYLPAFSCRVRIECTSSSDQKKTRMMVPCDVCSMDSGGFAWWLDVKSALSLGLPVNQNQTGDLLV